MPNVPNDQAARERILDDLDTTLLVEAGAGSGKTTSLVGRMVALIQSGSATVDHVAAITFTRKAAFELRTRFQTELEQAAKDSSVPAEQRQWLSQALSDIHLGFIGTIHSFCARLLRERPLEARVDPMFVEMEESEDSAFREACWDDYLHGLQETGQTAEMDTLVEMGVDVNELRAVYHVVSQYPDVEIALRDVDRPDFVGVRETLLELIEASYRFIPSHPPEKGYDNLQKAIRSVRRRQRYERFDDDATFARMIEQEFSRSLSATLNRWTSENEVTKRFRDDFQTWKTHRMEPTLRQWREYKYVHVIRFVQPAVSYCEAQRQANGYLNYQDLLMKAAELLRQSAEIRAYFRGRVERLLVDEFQDTDPIQAEVMFLLTGTDVREADWRKTVPSPGSLFIVGDPKQSIYRFRRADIATYNEVKARIKACGDVLQLSANFRSVHAIRDFVNGHFYGPFPEAETAEQAAFVPLQTQQPSPAENAGVFKLTYGRDLSNQDAVVSADSEAIAKWIAWACAGNVNIQRYNPRTDKTTNRPAQPGDFLILTDRKKYMHVYGDGLEQYGIPSDVTDSQKEYRELHDTLQLVQCLADPTDKVALVATLRGIFFGISDSQLYHYRSAGYTFSLYHIPAVDEVSDEARPVREALLTLREYLQWTRRLPPVSALAQILTQTGFIAYTAVLEAGTVRAGMMTTLLQYLHTESTRVANWFGLARMLRSLTGDGNGPGLAFANLFPGRTDVVRIMNLHKAKGLEAPIVFLAAPFGYSDHDAESHVDRSSDPAEGYFMVTKRDGWTTTILAQPPDWENKAERERRFMAAERDRLLYVAATRARQMLCISQWEERRKDPWAPFAESLENAPELAVPDVVPVKREELTEGVDLDAHREGLQVRVAVMSRPTWVRTSVTKEVKAVGVQPARAGGGLGVSGEGLTVSNDGPSVSSSGLGTADDGSHVSREGREVSNEISSASSRGLGTSFGTAVHRCIEAVGNGLSRTRLRTMAVIAARDAGLDAAHVDKVVEAAQGVLDSDLWKRSLLSKRRLFEVPFTITTPADDKTLWLAADETAADSDDKTSRLAADGTAADSDDKTQSEAPHGPAIGDAVATTLVLQGVIDMMFEEEDGWVIVDFKTDSFEPEEQSQVVGRYADQVHAYANVWRKQFGQPVKEGGLYFTRLKKYVEVELS